MKRQKAGWEHGTAPILAEYQYDEFAFPALHAANVQNALLRPEGWFLAEFWDYPTTDRGHRRLRLRLLKWQSDGGLSEELNARLLLDEVWVLQDFNKYVCDPATLDHALEVWLSDPLWSASRRKTRGAE